MARIWASLDGVVAAAELLPLLEKFGKTCVVLFRPGDVHFIQKPVDADGMQVTARCSKVSRRDLACKVMSLVPSVVAPLLQQLEALPHCPAGTLL